MRYKFKPSPKEGTRRIKTKFLWLPKSINGELRWLERASYREEFRVAWGIEGMCDGWESIEWVEEANTL